MSEPEVVTVPEEEILDVEVEKDVLEANRKLAEEVRKALDAHGVKAIDVMGSIGSGKTTIIEELVKRLKTKYSIAVISGDVATSIDAKRILQHGVEAIQVNTGKECHLDANLVKKALGRLDLSKLDLLFIENVGNLICPAEFPLGAHKRVVVVSVTEGPYMVVKHPMIFAEADVVVINKVDLAQAMGVDVDKLAKDCLRVNPRAKVVRTVAREGVGVDELTKALEL